MKAYILILLILGSGLLSSAQNTYTIKGRVADAGTGDYLEFANIIISDSTNTQINAGISGKNGTFKIDNIPQGKINLKLSYLGFLGMDTTLLVQKDLMLGKLVLKPKIEDLSEVEIAQEAKGIEYRPDKQVINVSQQAMASGGNAADVLAASPSISVDAEGNISLRGNQDFQLLINGLPSQQNASDALAGIQAENIHQIEVITSPSAKWAAEGSSGIINIIMKKKQLSGLNALLNGSIATGHKQSVGLSIDKQSGKYRIYGGMHYSDKTKVNESQILRNQDPEGYEIFNSTRDVRYISSNIDLGCDIDISPRNSLSFGVEAGNWEYQKDILGSYENNVTSKSTDTREIFSNINQYLSSRFTYKRKLDDQGQEITLTLNSQHTWNELPNQYSESNPIYYRKLDNTAHKNLYKGMMDHQIPLGKKIKIESGIHVESAGSSQDYACAERRSESVPWSENPSLSDAFEFSRDIAAIYSMGTISLKPVEIAIGIRAETEFFRLQNNTANNETSHTGLFPSLTLQKSIKQTQQISLAYTRRIGRPNEWQLNPLMYSLDAYSLRRGNPALDPEFTHSIELGYGYHQNKFSIRTQAYYRSTTGSLFNTIIREEDDFTETYLNLETSENSGLECMISSNPAKWLKLSLAFSSYYYTWNGRLLDQSPIQGETWVTHGNFRTSVNLYKSSLLQFIAVYYAPSKAPQVQTESFYYFDFIFRQQLLQNKLSITLRTHNTFDTGLLEFNTSGPGYEIEETYRYEGPTLILGISYKLNNYRRPGKDLQPIIEFDQGLDH